jgi:hypothetical protein
MLGSGRARAAAFRQSDGSQLAFVAHGDGYLDRALFGITALERCVFDALSGPALGPRAATTGLLATLDQELGTLNHRQKDDDLQFLVEVALVHVDPGATTFSMAWAGTHQAFLVRGGQVSALGRPHTLKELVAARGRTLTRPILGETICVRGVGHAQANEPRLPEHVVVPLRVDDAVVVAHRHLDRLDPVVDAAHVRDVDRHAHLLELLARDGFRESRSAIVVRVEA